MRKVALAVLVSCVTASHAVATADANVSSSTEAFLQWFKARGGKAPAATIATFPDMGRGLLAVSPLAEGDVLLSVPTGLVISQRNLARRWPGTSPQDRSIYGAVPGDAAVALFLMKESFLGDASEWSPYLACLPSDVPHTASFSDEELALLEDPRLQASAAQRRHAYARMHASLLPALQWLLGNVAANAEALAEAASLERFRWAMSIVDSRALTLRGEKMLVPFADMVNHRPHPKGRLTQGGEFFAKSHPVTPDGGMTVLADRNFAPGEQIFEDYGDNPDQIYLDYHGFVPFEHNDHDCVWLETILPSAAAAAAASTATAATSTAATFHCVPASGRIEAAAERAAEAALAARSLALGQPPAPAARSRDAVAAVRQATAAAACRRLARYRQGAAADAALLASLAKSKKGDSRISGGGGTSVGDGSGNFPAGLSARGAMAIAYRLRKKQLLQRIIASSVVLPETTLGEEDLSVLCPSMPLGLGVSAEEEVLAPLVDAFNDWMEGLGCPAKKLRAAFIPGMRIGAVATGSIEREELYLSVPEWATLDAATAANDAAVGPAVTHMAAELGPHDWDPDFDSLLLLLVHEAFVRREKGRHWPYVALLPSPDEVESPLFFSEADLSRLAGSDMAAAAARYRAAAAAAYDRKWRRFGIADETSTAETVAAEKVFVVGSSNGTGNAANASSADVAAAAPAAGTDGSIGAAAAVAATAATAAAAAAASRGSETEVTTRDTAPRAKSNGFSLPVRMTPERHLWGTAMLDSRSIWWHGRRHLVPLLDLVNCAAAPPSGGRVHSTRAARSRSAGVVAETNAAWKFNAGEQVLEDYGQPNHVYFLYHGFSLPDNPHDCIYVSSLSVAASAASPASRASLERSFGPPDERRNFCVSATRLEPGFVAYVRGAAGLPPPAAAAGKRQEVAARKNPAAAAQVSLEGLLDAAGRAAVADWARRRLEGYPELPPAPAQANSVQIAAATVAAARVDAFVASEKAVLRTLLASIIDGIGGAGGGGGTDSSSGGGSGGGGGSTGTGSSGGGAEDSRGLEEEL